ncbi:transcriptional regulator ATRX homolog isoform X2 [Belonocnema kinseyi]|uniref:transcriptional regulator ATRX homolog isoform X2 n=1 Tax=Belonocnema kinseyi TaxID=2817044 RepID=UPI00143D63D5|nr:transcriptional regulator ATRX homolog isoform X2 [Belonocnema kinseyi]
MANEPKVKPTDEEEVYRTRNYRDFRVVSKRQLVCTACGNGVSTISGNVFSHPILGVLQCETCMKKFQQTNFKTKKGKCILCCNNSTYKCEKKSCRYEFCRNCIKRNVNKCIKQAEEDDWKCFVCDPKPFWQLRGVCAVIMSSPSKKKQFRHVSRERSQEPTSGRIKHPKTNSPFLKRELRKSKKTLQSLNFLCEDSEEDKKNSTSASRPIYLTGVDKTSKKSRLSSTSSTSFSEDFEPSQNREISKKESSRKVTKSPSPSSNSSSYFQKSKRRNKENSKPQIKHRRKLYTRNVEELVVTPVDISGDEAHEKKQKQASLRFKTHFLILFENAKSLLLKFSDLLDKCEQQCLEQDNIQEDDALKTTKRFEKILKHLETETAEKCKEIDQTYKSWYKNFSSCFRTENGIRKNKRRNSSTSNKDEQGEESKVGKEVTKESGQNGVVSECDSDAIFSGDETRRRSSEKVSEDSKDEIGMKSVKDRLSRNRNSRARSSAGKNSRTSSTEKSPLEKECRKSWTQRSSSKRSCESNSYEITLEIQNGNFPIHSSLEKETPWKIKSSKKENLESERKSDAEEEEAKKKLLLSDSDDAQRSTPKSYDDSVESASTVLGNVSSPVQEDSPEVSVSGNDKDSNFQAKKMLLESSSDCDSKKDTSGSEKNDVEKTVKSNKVFSKKDTLETESPKIDSEIKNSEENKSASDNQKPSEELEKNSEIEREELTIDKNSSSDNSKEMEVPNKKKIKKIETSKKNILKKTTLSSESELEVADKESTSKSQSDKSANEKAKKNLLKSTSDSSSEVDMKAYDSDDNIMAKRCLLNSSSGDNSPDLFNSIELKTSKRKPNNSDSENSESCRSLRRKRFKISKNLYFRADKKLRMSCHVGLTRLTRTVLRKHAKALQRSKQHLEKEKFKSLVSMDNIEKPRKKVALVDSDDDSDSGSNHHNRKKQQKGNNETLLDHLKKVENGEAENKADSKPSEEESGKVSKNKTTKENLFAAADERAKEALLNSSDSDLEATKDPVEETDSDKTKKKKKEKKDDKKDMNESKEEASDEDKNRDDDFKREEQKEERKEKLKWKHDKILKMKISDSDSEAEQKKWNKSQEKLKAKKKGGGSSSNDDDPKIVKVKKKRTKRKILDSDSDIKLTDVSDSDCANSDDDVKVKEDTKKSRKRVACKSSDSDSSLGEKKPKAKRKRIKAVTDSESDSEAATNSQGSPLKGGRRNIRKVLKDKQVAEDTKQAAKEEEERLKRIADRQKLYNEMYEIRLAGEEKVEKLVLDFDEETKEELVSVHPDLVKRLKPHQAQGIKFMWDACFESLERVKNSKGSGCIIAHCMGLGKTFQIVSLVHTLLSHEETKVKTVMVVCPLSTALNWAGEFEMWLKDLDNYDDMNIYELGKHKQNFERKYQLEHWQKNGGVLIIGYDMFRNLTASGKKMRKSMQETILKCLVDPGPDVVVCDEGHLLKNEDTALSKAMRKIKSLRRIVLTGTPLQNNLIEYHCMVQFVKPNLLGTKKEFSNRFVNPIKNGSAADSTPYDVKLMKKRAFILHNLLEGSVQRFDYSVLTPFLPPKNEYVISVKLTPLQVELYQYYLDNFTRGAARGPRLFPDYHALQRICTHPIVMKMNAEKIEKKRQEEDTDSEGSLKDFVVDGSDTPESSSEESGKSGSDIQCIDSDKEAAPVKRRGTRANPIDDTTFEVEPEIAEPREWWSEMIKPEHLEDVRISAKLVLLFGILKESEQIGDKVLVFSQSLYSLTLIEDFLSQIDEATQNNSTSENLENHTGSWSLGLDYFRLDGQTSAENRSQWCKIFNRPTNTRARLFLISTRAGGLGINLTAANRVIIFDASWNPSHDVQSIFRIYRFGQKKPCYIYRFLSKGTMEEKIYNRQVSKLSLACRVIDEQQIERHFNSSDLAELYSFDPNPPKESEILSLPKDRLLAEIFLKYKDHVHNYHEHDSLLENKLDEVLDEEDRKIAWQEYEDEKKGKPVMQFQQHNQFGLNPMAMNNLLNGQLNIEIENMMNLYKLDFPNLNPQQLRQLAQSNIMSMYNYVEGQNFARNTPNQYLTQQYAPLMQPRLQQQQEQLRQQQQEQIRQQQLIALQRQQQERYAQMPPARAPTAMIDISSPTKNQED